MTWIAGDLARRADSAEALFRDAIESVECFVPEAHERFVAALGDHDLAVQIGAETFVLRDGAIGKAPLQARATLATNEETLHALVAGAVGLTDAISNRTLELVGSPSVIAAVDRSLRLLIHGIVRSPDAPGLMRRLEALAHRSPPAHAQTQTEEPR